jgi:pimeloyl-ACP methyl ester carboxylesterase
MLQLIQEYFRRWRFPAYRRLPPLVLINGLAEQSESWFCNRAYWQRHFEVKVPELLVYEGPMLQRRLEEGLPITVDYLTDQLEAYLERFVQTPPYHLVASSLGGQIAVEYAVRHPEMVNRIVLLCPSGFGSEEKLPVVEGVRHNDFETVVRSVFYHPRFAHPGMVHYYQDRFSNKTWRKGVLRTIRGTSSHCIRDKLPRIHQRTLIICGREDHVIDSAATQQAVASLPHFRVVVLPRCGHAPQIEQAAAVNRLVHDFLAESPEAGVPGGTGVPPVVRNREAERTPPEPAPLIANS